MAEGIELLAPPPPPCSLTLIRDHYGDGGLDFDSYMKHKRICMNPRSKTTIDQLCDPLLIEIFLRLPIKSAKRCAAVCKQWYALISDPHFIRRFEQGLTNENKNFAFICHYHELMAVKNIVVGSNRPDFESRGFSLAYLPCYRRQRDFVRLPSVVASCNDLLLCCEEHWLQYIYYLCNPFTQEWLQLPLAPPPGYPEAVGLICDNNSTATARYALLRIARLCYSHDIVVHIFSSDTGEWRVNVVSIAPRKVDDNLIYRENGIPFNGLLFWFIPQHGLLGLDPYDGGRCRYFIDLPEEFHVTPNCGFGVCMGRLRFFQIVEDPLLDIPLISIWDLKSLEGGEWVLQKQVYFRDMVGISKKSNFAWLTKVTSEFLPHVLGCVPDDGDVIHIVALNTHENICKVVSCNMRMGTLEEVCDIPSNHDEFLITVNTCKLSWHPTPIPAIPSPAGKLSFATWPLNEEEDEVWGTVYA